MLLKVCDSTLRDGEQQACINFSQDQKLEIAAVLNRLGVDELDMMPCQNEVEQATVRQIVKAGIPVANLTPLRQEFIDQSLSLSPRIMLLQAMSDKLLAIRYHTNDVSKARADNLKQFLDMARSVKKRCPAAQITIAGEDVINADVGYLKETLSALEPYCVAFAITDSKGTATPDQITCLVQELKKAAEMDLLIHTHNDLGQANANAVAGIRAGANILSGTLLGLGERAGNCDIRKVLMTLRSDGIIFPGINYDLFDEAEAVVRRYAQYMAPEPMSERAFWHETGLHVNALLSDPEKGYSAVDPKTLGFTHKIFFGKSSGTANWKYFLGDSLDEQELIQCRDVIKALSIQHNRSYSFEEAVSFICDSFPELKLKIDQELRSRMEMNAPLEN